MIGEPKTVKKLRSGERLIEVSNSTEADKFKKCTHFASIAVSITTHGTLNTYREVILEPDLWYLTEDEMVNNLK